MDRPRGHADAVRFQVSAEHCRGRPEGRLAEGNGRKGRDRVVGEPPPVTTMVPKPAARMAGAANLRDDDGADDIYRIRRLEVGGS